MNVKSSPKFHSTPFKIGPDISVRNQAEERQSSQHHHPQSSVAKNKRRRGKSTSTVDLMCCTHSSRDTFLSDAQYCLTEGPWEMRGQLS